MLTQKHFKIKNIPSVLWGEPSDEIYIYIHGKCGCKEEAQGFAEIACTKLNCQVLSFDLPEHGERKSEKNTFYPWIVVPELKKIIEYVKKRYSKINVRANSIGAWFSMLAFKEETADKALFVSPILDMKHLIENMMSFANVSVNDLEEKQEIETSFGEKLSFRYFTYAKENEINNLFANTFILYAGGDNLTERCVVKAFSEKFGCKLSIMEDGEHWFHTEKQLKVLNKWTYDTI